MISDRFQQSGFALVLVLWILSVLIIMAGSFALSMRRESAIIEGIKHNAETQTIAESGIALAEMMLLNPDNATRWRADGSIYQVDFAKASVRIRLRSEFGKIDLNSAPKKLLEAVMSHAPIDEDKQLKVLNAILDWRDSDENVRDNGAEKPEYRKAKLSYGPRNKRFRSLEELQMVLGMNETLYQWLEPLVTVYSGQEVELKLATREVLQVLPEIDTRRIDEYLTLRHQNTLNGLPAPDFPVNANDVLENPADLEQRSESANTEDNTGDEESDAGAVEITAEVQQEEGPNTLVSVIVEQEDSGTGSPFKVIQWRRNYSSAVSLFAEDMNEFLVGQYAEPQFDD